MEDLTKNLSELSLSDREHAGFVLPKIHKSGEYIIVAKFLTSCYLIMEAVVHTFQQRWRSVTGYKSRNLGDHRVLFVFDNSSDVERIIKNQPWSFDKHLVVLQTFEEFSKLKDLVFDKALFRVQVHDIAESIWETIGEVRRSPESIDDDGGNFIRECFTVDITLPLCQGRVFKLENGEKSWFCFQYERYGHLKHYDKQCELWIRSQSSPTTDKQQFGSYLRAAPYQTSGKREILVPGYYGQVATTEKVSS